MSFERIEDQDPDKPEPAWRPTALDIMILLFVCGVAAILLIR